MSSAVHAEAREMMRRSADSVGLLSLDLAAWVLVAAVVGGAFVADALLTLESNLYRVLGWTGVLAVVTGLALTTQTGRAFWKLFGEARVEIRRVFWPTRPETVRMTLLVMAVVAVLGLVLWGMDSVLGLITTSILG